MGSLWDQHPLLVKYWSFETILEFRVSCHITKLRLLKSCDLASLIRAPKHWFETKDFELDWRGRGSRSNDSRSAVPNWLKWFALRGPELTQMIRAPLSRTDSNDSRSAVPNWLKWFTLRCPKLTQMIRGPELTQMIRAPRSRTDSNDSHSTVPNWIKWFALRGPELTQMIRTPRSRTESNDSLSAVPKWLKWFAFRGPELTPFCSPEH